MKPHLIVRSLALLSGLCAALAPVAATAGSSATGAAASSSASNTANAPYAFRGIPLGITLDEFRAGSTVRATPLGSVPVCETDLLAGSLGMRLKARESMVVACRWAHRGSDGWAVSQAVVDGTPAQDHVLRFARKDGQSALRLYEISFVIDEVTAEDLRDALGERYGPPHLVRQSAQASQTADHASPALGTLPVYVWENAVSSITLCFLPASRTGTLTYLMKDPDAWVKSVVRQWQGTPPEAG
ncbi:hypothetical protein [Paraburkholderia sp.]|uniref:hypothetical protein n=1 Tax=Paraburkholderia sp. TaxID=1926495 RepID=UPI00239E54AA|nr:hypothetical protein [Paraburkholderia sp.]MDE1180684.1 hypothetical protein [Paraburkholderia sp.]